MNPDIPEQPITWTVFCPKCGCVSDQSKGADCPRSHKGCDGVMKPLDDPPPWLTNPGRTQQFQAFLDSLETKAVKKANPGPARYLTSTWATRHFNPQ